jgi:hypothetical protein
MYTAGLPWHIMQGTKDASNPDCNLLDAASKIRKFTFLDSTVINKLNKDEKAGF